MSPSHLIDRDLSQRPAALQKLISVAFPLLFVDISRGKLRLSGPNLVQAVLLRKIKNRSVAYPIQGGSTKGYTYLSLRTKKMENLYKVPHFFD